MELNVTANLIEIYISSTESQNIFPYQLDAVLSDGREFIFDYKREKPFEYLDSIAYADITAYNGGGVPSYATILSDLLGFIADAQGNAPALTSYYDGSNLAAGTHYFASPAGQSMDGYNDMSLTGSLLDADGTVTLSVEGSNDETALGANWIQLYGYDTKNALNTNSLTVTNGTLTFSWDFDNLNYKYYRVVVVTNGATNTLIIKERKKV